jgi:hypothetical protein
MFAGVDRRESPAGYKNCLKLPTTLRDAHTSGHVWFPEYAGGVAAADQKQTVENVCSAHTKRPNTAGCGQKAPQHHTFLTQSSQPGSEPRFFLNGSRKKALSSMVARRQTLRRAEAHAKVNTCESERIVSQKPPVPLQ